MLGAIVVMAASASLSAPVAASGTPDPPPPAPEEGLGSDPSALVQVPAGCPAPEPADVAFVGTVLAKDEYVEKGTVRFQIEQVRAGNEGPYAVNGVIDVRYGPDSQYLDIDEQYLVSAAVDTDIGSLASKVSPEAPLFGGDAVVDVNDTDVECPEVDDPIMTINLDGTPVDSAVLTPLLADRGLLLSTIAVPAAIVGAVMIGLVLLRRAFDFGIRGIFALGRAAVVPTGDHRAARVRRHVSPSEAVALGLHVDDLDVEEPDEESDVDRAARRNDDDRVAPSLVDAPKIDA